MFFSEIKLFVKIIMGYTIGVILKIILTKHGKYILDENIVEGDGRVC